MATDAYWEDVRWHVERPKVGTGAETANFDPDPRLDGRPLRYWTVRRRGFGKWSAERSAEAFNAVTHDHTHRWLAVGWRSQSLGRDNDCLVDRARWNQRGALGTVSVHDDDITIDAYGRGLLIVRTDWRIKHVPGLDDRSNHVPISHRDVEQAFG